MFRGTYVSIPRLKAYDLARPGVPGAPDYVGTEWKPGVGYASGGAGYFLSRKAATIVAETLAITHWAEDLPRRQRPAHHRNPTVDRAPPGPLCLHGASTAAG